MYPTRFVAVALGLSAMMGLASCATEDARSNDAGAAATDARVPARPQGAPFASGTRRTFAVDHIDFGRRGWEHLGYDLDGLVSAKGVMNACKSNVPNRAGDGDRGIDNSFGQNILPLLDLLAAEHTGDDAVEAPQNRDIAAGIHTLLFEVDGLSAGASSLLGLKGQLFIAASRGGPPTFRPSESWPVREDLLASKQPFRARVSFADAYVANGTFVSGAPQSIEIEVRIQGLPFRIPIQRAVATWRTQGASLEGGVLAGIVAARDLVEETKTFIRRRFRVRCDGAGDQTIETFANYADILTDGRTDKTRACDGISFALGFTAKESQNVSAAQAEHVPSAAELCGP